MKFFKKQKRYITLLETLIAMSLLSVLLVIVFGFFKELSTISQLTLTKQKEAFQMRLVESRLAFLFERIVYDKPEKKDGDKKKANEGRLGKRTFYFYCEPPNDAFSAFPSLVFTFDNEIRQNPLFSGDILARLYVDKSEQLCLATWPIYHEEPHEAMHKEIILENVQGIDFDFYMPPERLKGKNDVYTPPIDPDKKSPERDVWYKNEWYKSYDQMPAILKISIVKEDSQNSEKVQKDKKDVGSWQFAFVLPTRRNYIYYPSNEG